MAVNKVMVTSIVRVVLQDFQGLTLSPNSTCRPLVTQVDSDFALCFHIVLQNYTATHPQYSKAIQKLFLKTCIP